MMFTIGNRVRFTGTFRDTSARRALFDPKVVIATISQGNRSETFTLAQGLSRDAVGIFSLEYTIAGTGTLLVRFESGGEGFSQQSYQVTDEELAGTPAYMTPEQPDELAVVTDSKDRQDYDGPSHAEMLDALVEAGYDREDLEDESWSYLAGIYETLDAIGAGARRDAVAAKLKQLIRKKTSAHDRYLAKQNQG